MSRTRTNSPIEDIDRIARQEGLELAEDGSKRTFTAFNRDYTITEAPAGKVGIFGLEMIAREEEQPDFTGTQTHDQLRKLFRRAVKWKEGVP